MASTTACGGSPICCAPAHTPTRAQNRGRSFLPEPFALRRFDERDASHVDALDTIIHHDLVVVAASDELRAHVLIADRRHFQRRERLRHTGIPKSSGVIDMK